MKSAIAAFLTLPCSLFAGPAEQAARWDNGSIDPKQTIALDKLVWRYAQTKTFYDKVEKMVPNGVPSAIAFGLFYREQDNSMRCNPANGDPLTHKTIHVPRNRIPNIPPPYTIEQATMDAYYSKDLDHLQTRNWSDKGELLWSITQFNGVWYDNHGLASPYTWNGIIGPEKYTYYKQGKFIRDGVYSRTFKDPQLGVAAILMRLRDKGYVVPTNLYQKPVRDPQTLPSSMLVLRVFDSVVSLYQEAFKVSRK